MAVRATLPALLLLFFVLQAYGALPHPSDEGIYAYQAARIRDGVLPYRDFFHAHPPLHLLTTALINAVTGVAASTIVDLVPTLCAAGQGVLAFVVVQRARKGAAGEIGGAFAAGLLLFSPSFMRAASSDTGIMQASLALALGAALLQRQRRIAAGLCIGAAPAILLQLAPAAAVLVTFSVRGREGRWRVLAFALVVFVGFQALALLWAGRAYADDVYLYQLAKPRVSGEGMRQLGAVLAADGGLFFAAACGAAITATLGGREGRWHVALALLWIAVTFVALGSRPRVFRFYFQPAFLPAAVLAGLGAHHGLVACAQARGRVGRGLAALTGLVFVLGALGAERLATPLFAPGRARELEELTREYTWTDAPVLSAGVNRLVRALLFKDGRREPGARPSRFTAYLWQRSRWLDTHPALVAAVRREAAERPVTLFGDSAVVPRVALDAGVLVTGDVADTNVQRFAAGSLAVGDVAALLDAHPDALVLLGRRAGLGALPEVRRQVLSRYEHVGSFVTRAGVAHDLYRRRSARRSMGRPGSSGDGVARRARCASASRGAPRAARDPGPWQGDDGPLGHDRRGTRFVRSGVDAGVDASLDTIAALFVGLERAGAGPRGGSGPRASGGCPGGGAARGGASPARKGRSGERGDPLWDLLRDGVPAEPEAQRDASLRLDRAVRHPTAQRQRDISDVLLSLRAG